MEVFYQGTNITDTVRVNFCIVRDSAAGRSDSLEIEFANAAGWYSWGPEEDDRILVSHGGYDSGIMYVNRILPEDGNFRIMASSLPCNARKKEWRSFRNKTIEEIMQQCAAASGMEYRIFGIDTQAVVPYIEQRNESCAAFLRRLLSLESAALKCVNGRYAAIGIHYAQDRAAAQTVTLWASQDGTRYRRDGTSYRSLTLKTPYACATAQDTRISDSHSRLTLNGCVPVLNNAQAGRWARGKLLDMNRQCESVAMSSTFNAGLTAMIRIDITGDTDAAGEWLVDEVEHDLINLSSVAILRRCIRAIQ